MSSAVASEVLGFTVKERIPRPAAEVYRAITDPAVSSKYFMRSSTGEMVKGAVVTWTWASHPPLAVTVEDAVANQMVRFRWDSHAGGPRTVATIRLSSPDAASTVVEIHEAGWADTPEGRKHAFDNCSGWTDMLKCLKAWLVHGIDLR